MSRNQNYFYVLQKKNWQNKDKITCQGSSLLEFQYTNKVLRHTGNSSCTQVFHVVMELQYVHVFETNLKIIGNKN